MTELHDRLERLAAEATDGIRLRHPEVAVTRHPRFLPLVVTATVAAAVLAAAIGLTQSGGAPDQDVDPRLAPAQMSTIRPPTENAVSRPERPLAGVVAN